jgi:putative peptidoglycan lipid II flippase
VVIAFLSHPITAVIYQHGRFTATDTAAVAQALVLYIVGIPFMAALRNVASVFYAYKDSKTPMYASFASIGLNLILNIGLMRVLGFLAFPLSTTIAAVVNIVLLVWLLPRKIGRFALAPVLRFFLALAGASASGGFAGWLLNRFLFGPMGHSFWVRLASVAVSGSAALGIFYALLMAFGVKEAKEYFKRFFRR